MPPALIFLISLYRPMLTSVLLGVGSSTVSSTDRCSGELGGEALGELETEANPCSRPGVTGLRSFWPSLTIRLRETRIIIPQYLVAASVIDKDESAPPTYASMRHALNSKLGMEARVIKPAHYAVKVSIPFV